MTPDLQALNDYIRQVRFKPFKWFERDCFIFTNEAFRKMYGRGYADDWAERYVKSGRYLRKKELIAEFGYSNIHDALSDKLIPISSFPPKGALVTTKGNNNWIISEALGIAFGSSALFLGKDRLESLPIEKITKAYTYG